MAIFKKEKKSADKAIPSLTTIASGYVSDELTQNLQEATRRVLHDSDQMVRVIEQYENVASDKLQGRALEFLEVLKFNREAALKYRFDLKAEATHFFNPHNPADINIYKEGHLVREIQSKSRDSAANAAFDLSDSKYHSMGRHVPKDMHEDVKELLDKRLKNSPSEQLYRDKYEDVKQNLMGGINYDNVSSPGTTRSESVFASEHPELVQFYYDGEAIISELGMNITEGTIISGGVATVSKALFNGAKVVRGKKELSEAISDTLACTTSAAVRGGTVSGMASGIRIIARSSSSEGIQSLSNGVAPVAIANTIFEMAGATRKFVKGNISKTEFKEECGTAAIKGIATYYCGIAGQVIIPIPVVGAIVGSVVGYITASMLVQSGILGVGPRNLVEASERRRLYVEKECMKAIELMGYYKNAFQTLTNQYNIEFANITLPLLTNIEESIINYSPANIIYNLSDFNYRFSKSLNFRTYEEFDRFMKEPSSKLIL